MDRIINFQELHDNENQSVQIQYEQENNLHQYLPQNQNLKDYNN